jgi:drug/metabolite transporter (DMT)-like permease
MLIFIYSFLYIVSIISDRILYFEYINVMSKYTWMISFIIYPILNFITLSFFVIYSLYKKKQNNNIHQKHFFIFGLLSIWPTFFYTLSIPNISLVSYTISSKINFILIMLFSYFFLKRRYKINHYIGSILCLIGVMINIIKNSDNKENNISYTLLFILGVFFDSIRIVYKEYFVKKINEFDIYRFSWNVNIWQIFWSGVLFFTILIPEFNHTPVTSQTITDYLSEGFKYEFEKKPIIYLMVSQITTLLITFFEYKVMKLYSSMAINILICVKGPLLLFTMYLLIRWNSVEVSKTQSESYVLAISDYFSLALTFIGSIIYFIRKEYTYKPINNNELLLPLTVT